MYPLIEVTEKVLSQPFFSTSVKLHSHSPKIADVVLLRVERGDGTISECVEYSHVFLRGICAIEGLVRNVDEQWKVATLHFEAALAEFEAATGVLIAKLKTDEIISDDDWQGERKARARVMEARDLVSRLFRLRKEAGIS